MERHERFLTATLPAPFYWLNEPAHFQLGDGLTIAPGAKTDFWQQTHYGFRNDNAPGCLLDVTGDFTLSTHVRFDPRHRYDQAGLLVRIDAENWIKVSTEYEDAALSRLGSVVTNLGYSDWATQDVSSAQREMWYRLSRRGADFLVEASPDGGRWAQLRIAHLHRPVATLAAGLYACSPSAAGFHARFLAIDLTPNHWTGE